MLVDFIKVRKGFLIYQEHLSYKELDAVNLKE
jgi:hypothetical protein